MKKVFLSIRHQKVLVALECATGHWGNGDGNKEYLKQFGSRIYIFNLTGRLYREGFLRNFAPKFPRLEGGDRVVLVK